jgi:tRNA 5-methylaminomethyl-2-thiouridine biosynthesis bifunctional protein
VVQAMSEPLEPATLAFDATGTPYSEAYGDVYHAAASGPGQARHVFIAGNDLPARWAGRERFTILEFGFGAGINFLATCAAWRGDPSRCRRLHYVALERHPFRRDDLARLLARYPELAAGAGELVAAWPCLVPGVHRLHLAHGEVNLTLVFADVVDALNEMRLSADAIYLDGFAPERNPAMWSPRTLAALARQAAEGATLATWSVARRVRDALAEAGFEVERHAGFAGKREMLVARLVRRRRRVATPAWRGERGAIVIGAGLAGASVAHRLVARGWRVTLCERAARPAAAASGLPLAVYQPHVSRDDCLLSRWTRAALLYAQAQRPTPANDDAMHANGGASPWRDCGVLQIAADADNEARVRDTAALWRYPADYARYVDVGEARALSAAPAVRGGWWFEDSGCASPAAVVAQRLAEARERVQLKLDCAIERIDSIDGAWHAWRADGSLAARAPLIVLANAGDAATLVDLGMDGMRSVRGQQSLLAAPPFRTPQTVVGGDGYVLPADDGVAVIGATYDLDRCDTTADAESDRQNLARAEAMLPGCTSATTLADVRGVAGIRAVTRDRMPLLGALLDVPAIHARSGELRGAHLHDLDRLPGAYVACALGSRGLTWSLLAAELLAECIEGEPLPVEASLADAMDPGRFVLQRVRRDTLGPI